MNSYTILLVDDGRSSRMAIKVQLELTGIMVTLVTNVDQALQALVGNSFNLLLCAEEFVTGDDCLVTRLKSDSRFYRLPIIIVAGTPDAMLWQKLVSLGANDVITQPFTGKELVEKVNRHLERGVKHQRFYRSELTEQVFALLNKNFNQELLTPLNGIINAISFSQSLPSVMEDESLGELLTLIDSSCFRIQRNTSNIRTYSLLKTESPEDAVKHVPAIPLQEMLNSILKKYQHLGNQASEMDVLIIDTGEWGGKEEWIRLLFTELLDNAIKFNAGSQPPSVKLHVLGHSLSFSVTNTIKNAPLFTLNDAYPFKKFHNDISRNGLGLGLYLCRTICEISGYHLTMSVKNQTVTMLLEA